MLVYSVNDLIGYFEKDNNFAAIEYFNDAKAGGMEDITDDALNGIFDEEYVRVIQCEVVGIADIQF
jgi:hypothetical protein